MDEEGGSAGAGGVVAEAVDPAHAHALHQRNRQQQVRDHVVVHEVHVVVAGVCAVEERGEEAGEAHGRHDGVHAEARAERGVLDDAAEGLQHGDGAVHPEREEDDEEEEGEEVRAGEPQQPARVGHERQPRPGGHHLRHRLPLHVRHVAQHRVHGEAGEDGDGRVRAGDDVVVRDEGRRARVVPRGVRDHGSLGAAQAQNHLARSVLPHLWVVECGEVPVPDIRMDTGPCAWLGDSVQQDD
mmetsp:Transcript_11767/g.24684  ORF Transcript_11767/g.24684 Transcript_11767/m.24684 type:complete len:241 (+) Transcript_11767:1069-1791(+)